MSEHVQSSVSVAAERVEAIIDAAENAAAGIREQAHAEADGYAERTKREVDRMTLTRIAVLSDMTGRLIERVDLLQAQADEMIRALEDTMRALAATVREPDPGGSPSGTPRPSDTDPQPAEGTSLR
jgi:hypothetical protein